MERGVDYSAVVSTPIGAAFEDPTDIEPTVQSIIDAAGQVAAPVLYMPNINFRVDSLRNERDRIATLEIQAQEMGTAIHEMTRGSNVRLVTIIDQELPGTTWPQRRSTSSTIALGTL